MGLGSTYRGLGEYQQSEETLRRGVREFPHNLRRKASVLQARYFLLCATS